MNLLLDENVSYRVCKKLSARFGNCQVAKRLDLLAKKDRLIWEHARMIGSAIVTFDEDFETLSQMRGWPPKVILLRPGNLTVDQTINLIKLNFDSIATFLNETNPHGRGMLKLIRIGTFKS